MIIETKKISPFEILVFLPQPLSIIGVFYSKDNSQQCEIINNINSSSLASEALLTSDFLYLKSNTKEQLEELKLLSLAELDDYYDNPKKLYSSSDNIEQKIIFLLQLIISPYLKKDGGDIKFISYQNNIVCVSFLGKCHGCPYAKRTLKEHVEKNLIRYLPEIKEVILTW